MNAIKQWTIPVAILVAWLATAGYTVARLSWASEAWQKRAAAEAAQPVPDTAPEIAQPSHPAAAVVAPPGPAKVAQAAPATPAEGESTQPPPRLGRRLLARPARPPATSLR